MMRVLMWLKKGLGPRAGMSSALGALDEVFNPSAARAREDVEAQHERVIPVPSPGDRMLREGRVHITVREAFPED